MVTFRVIVGWSTLACFRADAQIRTISKLTALPYVANAAAAIYYDDDVLDRFTAAVCQDNGVIAFTFIARNDRVKVAQFHARTNQVDPSLSRSEYPLIRQFGAALNSLPSSWLVYARRKDANERDYDEYAATDHY